MAMSDNVKYWEDLEKEWCPHIHLVDLEDNLTITSEFKYV